MANGGGFLRPFGTEEVHPVQQRLAASMLDVLREEWDALAQRIVPTTGRPDHTRVAFFNRAKELDEFLRRWTELAESNPSSKDSILETARTAHKSLITLLEEAKSVFESDERQRVEHQKRKDQTRWQHELDRKKYKAEMEARLQKTQEEIQDIYARIANDRKISRDRRNAMWMASHFPQSTCACGGFKSPYHIHCFDCAQSRRGFGF